jgi:hypothetical protein
MARKDRHTSFSGAVGGWRRSRAAREGGPAERHRVEPRRDTKDGATSFSSTLFGWGPGAGGWPTLTGRSIAGDRLIFEGFDPGSE